jgi:hypothetical protein
MTRVRCWFAGLFVLGSCALFGISCAGTANKDAEEPKTPASRPAEDPAIPNSSDAVSGCPGDRPGQPKECKSNEDCCQGFSCSLDPERSRIVRYCLEG